MGAFGELVASHIADDFRVWTYDPRLPIGTERRGVLSTTLERVAGCDVVVIATPVSSFEAVLRDIGRACKPGALIVDVGSVKVIPARLMLSLLPQTVHMIATHPLFGPQSARGGLSGLKIAVCPLRDANPRPLVRFLARRLGLEVILTTPEEHGGHCEVVYEGLEIPDSQRLLVKFSLEEQPEEAEVIYINPEAPQLNVAKYIYEYICLAIPLFKVYDCENDDPRPCNEEALRFLSNGGHTEEEAEKEEEEPNPIWAELKKLSNDN